jgi:hypothetical protein
MSCESRMCPDFFYCNFCCAVCIVWLASCLTVVCSYIFFLTLIDMIGVFLFYQQNLVISCFMLCYVSLSLVKLKLCCLRFGVVSIKCTALKFM